MSYIVQKKERNEFIKDVYEKLDDAEKQVKSGKVLNAQDSLDDIRNSLEI